MVLTNTRRNTSTVVSSLYVPIDEYSSNPTCIKGHYQRNKHGSFTHEAL